MQRDPWVSAWVPLLCAMAQTVRATTGSPRLFLRELPCLRSNGYKPLFQMWHLNFQLFQEGNKSSSLYSLWRVFDSWATRLVLQTFSFLLVFLSGWQRMGSGLSILMMVCLSLGIGFDWIVKLSACEPLESQAAVAGASWTPYKQVQLELQLLGNQCQPVGLTVT